MTDTARPGRKSRRPRGEGSITRDGAKWIVRVWAGQRRLKRTTRTQAEALLALTELRGRAGLGITQKYTVADCLDDFIAHGIGARGWAPATVRAYRSVCEVHLRPVLGKRQIVDLSVREVQQLIERLLADGQSGRHAAHVRGVLRAAITHAMRREIVHRNVAALAAAPSVRKPETRALSADETTALFVALEGERLRTLIVTGATLGLRRGELIALRASDVDLDDATLTVRRTGTRISGEHVEGQPKSARSRRTISLPPALVTLLRRQSAAVAEEKLRLGGAWQDDGRVFPAESGGPVGATTIRKALDRGLQRAQVKGHLRIHDLRHTAATALLRAGGSLRDVQEMLGHASYSLTADTYAHVLDDQRKATAERIERAMGTMISGA